jgi:hypothetical protein
MMFFISVIMTDQRSPDDDRRPNRVRECSNPVELVDARCSRRRRFIRTPGSVQFYSARRMEAPRTVDDVFDNFSARRDGLIKALTTGARSHRLAGLGTSPGGPKPARGREIYEQTFAFPVAIGCRRAGTRGYPPASEAAFAARASIISLTQILPTSADPPTPRRLDSPTPSLLAYRRGRLLRAM